VARAVRQASGNDFLTADQGFFTLEPATPRDVPALFELDVLCFGPRAWSWAAWWEVASWPGWTCQVLRHRSRVVGALVMLLWPPVAQLASVAVHPRFRSRGLGSWMLQEAIASARRASCRWVALEVDRDNPAVRLYRRLGFGVARRFREDGLARLEMVRRLRRCP